MYEVNFHSLCKSLKTQKTYRTREEQSLRIADVSELQLNKITYMTVSIKRNPDVLYFSKT